MASEADVTIRELRIAIVECENAIYAAVIMAVQQFKERTSMTPSGISIDMVDVTTIGQSNPVYAVGSVDVKVEV